MASEILVNTGSGNGLLPDGTKPLPEPILTYYQWHSPEGNFMGNSQGFFFDMCLKINNLILQLHLPGANELMALCQGLNSKNWWYDKIRLLSIYEPVKTLKLSLVLV